MNVYIIVALGFVVYFLALAWFLRDRPLTDFDRECSRIDEELDCRARDERRARSDLYGDRG